MKKKSEVNIFYEKSKWAGHGHFIRSERLYRSLKKRGYYGKIYCNKNSNEIVPLNWIETNKTPQLKTNPNPSCGQ